MPTRVRKPSRYGQARARKFAARVDVRARPLKAAIDRWMDRVVRRAIRNALVRYRGPVLVRKSADDDARELARIIRVFGVRRVDETAREVSGSLLVGGSWEIAPDVAREFYRDKEIKIVEYLREGDRELAEAIRERLQDYEDRDIKEGVQGLTRRLYSDLRDKGSMSPARAERIARTETAQAENFGIFKGFEVSGVKTIEWVTIMDDRARDDHKQMNGQTIALGDSFEMPDGSRLHYPCDPTGTPGEIINCRCTVIPVEFHDEIQSDELSSDLGGPDNGDDE